MSKKFVGYSRQPELALHNRYKEAVTAFFCRHLYAAVMGNRPEDSCKSAGICYNIKKGEGEWAIWTYSGTPDSWQP